MFNFCKFRKFEQSLEGIQMKIHLNPSKLTKQYECQKEKNVKFVELCPF